jgi:hypothetical protein
VVRDAGLRLRSQQPCRPVHQDGAHPPAHPGGVGGIHDDLQARQRLGQALAGRQIDAPVGDLTWLRRRVARERVHLVTAPGELGDDQHTERSGAPHHSHPHRHHVLLVGPGSLLG